MAIHLPALREHLNDYEIPAQVYLMDWYANDNNHTAALR
jgi:hypothetical protein